ncbi:GH92 family glycosyl hydrolase [Desertivirga xinjiangensis]|uniref:GH92 family glycosyl hydrolase n=1 Tax=Desertivirga xinjiangensis TaxID=539206 RepID=UPI00210B79FD|nr:GH92 family glycosyl hydrolase [Pedobacter xinjiangensis]
MRGGLIVMAVMAIASEVFGQAGARKLSPLDYVDPLIGTGISTTESARLHSQDGSELRGQTFPAVGVPHGMTSWTPQTQATETKCVAPYYYEDKKIQGFRASHWLSGSCTQDYGSMTIMPMKGALEIDPIKRASNFSHAKEKARPYSYSVWLDDSKIATELSALSHSGILQFRFSNKDDAYVVIEPNSDEGEGFIEIDPEKREIRGYNPVHRIYQGLGKPAGFSGYFVVVFDTDFDEYGTWKGKIIQKNEKQQMGTGQAVGAFVKLAFGRVPQVHVKVGYSFTSINEARKNLQAEIPGWNLGEVKAKAKFEWENELSRIRIEGGNEQQKTMFYTALYHSKLLPRITSDVNGSYNAFASNGIIKKAQGFAYYDDFSLWDTYRAAHPLLTILEPKRTEDMMESLVTKAEEGGWLPIFPCWNSYTSAMIGDHATAMLGDALVKGIGSPLAERAYKAMRKNAFDINEKLEDYKEGKGRRALRSYLEYNYIPLEDSVPDAFHKEEQVSRTLEYAYDDYVLSRVALKLGKEQDYKILSKRAANFKNVFDTISGYVRGRYASGKWIESFDPNAIRCSFITEGSPSQYTWYVPHDLPELLKLMGGNERFINRLDTLFNLRYYWHGNEPGHQTAYLYAMAGAPWKTQNQVHKIIREEYSIGPGGLSGNEDAGQMSAWLVFSMLGFYPVCPGNPDYIIGSPLFPKAEFYLADGKVFTIEAINASQQNRYIQSALLNGNEINEAQLKHKDLIGGGKLVLQMGPKENLKWANKGVLRSTSN